MEYRVEIEKISYVYVSVEAESADEAFKYAELNAESLFNGSEFESAPDLYNVFDEIEEAQHAS
jgi:hypothetical protein